MWDETSLMNVSLILSSTNGTSVSEEISTTSETLYTNDRNYEIYECVEDNKPPLKNEVAGLPKFGEFQENYGWVECKSKSVPGKSYFFNVKSGCNTWIRPVARSIQIPRYSVKSRKHLPDDEQSVPLIVSDDEDQNRDYKKNNQFANIQHNEECEENIIGALNIASNVYYCPQTRFTDEEYNIKHFNKLSRKSAEDNFEQLNTTDPTTTSLYHHKIHLDEFDTRKSNFSQDEENNLSSILITDFLEIDFSHKIMEDEMNQSEGLSSIASSNTSSSVTTGISKIAVPTEGKEKVQVQRRVSNRPATSRFISLRP
ncbi:hypothetical protein KM043_009550 [Ampulex compressa]|nr:hypothetical protein KM043_009550 [Ampulex compressa]